MKTEQAVVALIASNHIKPSPEYPKIVANLILNDLRGLMGDKLTIQEVEKDKWHIKQLISDLAFLMSQGIIESRHAKKLLQDAWDMEPYAWDIGWHFMDTKMLEETGTNEIDELILKLLGENEKIAKDIRNGKVKAAGSLIGPIMRETGGKVDPKSLTTRIQELASHP